jgi:hypothetical protein
LISAAQPVDLLVAIRAVVLLGVGLHVVALMNSGPANPSRSAAPQHHGGVFVRTLLGVADLGPCDLEDEGAGVHLLRRAMTARAVTYDIARTLMAGTVKAARVVAAHRQVEVVNRRRPDAGGAPASGNPRACRQLARPAETAVHRAVDESPLTAPALVTLTRRSHERHGLTASIIP